MQYLLYLYKWITNEGTIRKFTGFGCRDQYERCEAAGKLVP